MCLLLHVRRGYACRSTHPLGLGITPVNAENAVRELSRSVLLTKGDEELRVVRVLRAIVRHTDQATVDEPQAWVYLILEGLCALSMKT